MSLANTARDFLQVKFLNDLILSGNILMGDQGHIVRAESDQW